MVKVTPIASVRTILDAANPAAASAGVLALLEDEDLEVASIGLTDGTGTALADGRLSLNAASQVVIHDNESNAEDLPHLVNSLESLNFASRDAASIINAATYSRKLADIPLPASALTNGKRLHITGRLSASWTGGTKPNGGAYIVLCKEGEDPQGAGEWFAFAEGVSSEERAVNITFEFSVSVGVFLMTTMPGPLSIIQKNSSGTITHEAAWDSPLTISQVSGTEGEPLKLQVYLTTTNSSGTVTADLFAFGQLSVIHE